MKFVETKSLVSKLLYTFNWLIPKFVVAGSSDNHSKMSVITSEEDAPYQVCNSMVVEGSKALCCDLCCDGWIHSACLGISASTYSMLKKLKGCWWVCDGCVRLF